MLKTTYQLALPFLPSTPSRGYQTGHWGISAPRGPGTAHTYHRGALPADHVPGRHSLASLCLSLALGILGHQEKGAGPWQDLEGGTLLVLGWAGLTQRGARSLPARALGLHALETLPLIGLWPGCARRCRQRA